MVQGAAIVRAEIVAERRPQRAGCQDTAGRSTMGG